MGKGIRTLLAVAGSVLLLSMAVAFRQADDSPAAAAPRWWKGNLHTHSFWSDGDDFPEMIADWYKRHGYHFLGLSDHNILSDGDKWIDAEGKEERVKAVQKYRARFGAAWVEERTAKDKAQVRLKPLREFRSLLEEPGRFLMIPAEEISHQYAKAPLHINAVNLRDVILPTNGDSMTETIQVNLRAVDLQRQKTGWRTIAFLNHPNFGWAVRAEDMVLAEELRFFEIQNGHPSVRNYGDDTHVSSEQMWDIVLALRLGKFRLPLVYGMGTDDAHAYHVFDIAKANPGRAWIMVRASHLSAESIVRGLETGDYYVSTGVVLDDIRREKDEVRLQIRPEKGVTYRTQFIATLRGASFESEARLDKDGKALPVTRLYSNEIGKVVAESNDLNPRYQLTGKELYVRAKVISSKPHPNPYAKGDLELAWTQPFLP